MYVLIVSFYLYRIYSYIAAEANSLWTGVKLVNFILRRISNTIKQTTHSTNARTKRPNSGLKVIGVGLPRTGTSSLTQALHDLGYGKCHHMSVDVVMDSFPYRKGRKWRQIFEEKDKASRQSMIREIFDQGDFEATMDFPPCVLADDLVEMFPDAKFVLSVRKSGAAWRQSFNSTIGMTKAYWFQVMTFLVPSLRLSLQPLHSGWDVLNARRFNGAQAFHSNSSDLYYRHNEWIKQVVPADRLLVHEASEGWSPLCRFLGKEVPTSAYPKVCDTKHFQSVVYVGAGVGLMIWLCCSAAVAGACQFSGLF